MPARIAGAAWGWGDATSSSTLGINDWYLGCRPWQVRLRFNMPSLISKPSATGLVTLLAFLVVLVLALVFVSTKSVLRTKPGWSFGASMIGLGITGGLLYALSPARTFADVIQRALPLRMSPAGEVALTAVISSIAGALTASFRQGNLRLQLPTANGILRSVVGGTLMGIGIALIPGGNDGLIRSGSDSFTSVG